jgi:hypothetical protein
MGRFFSPLKANELVRPGAQWRWLNVTDLAILLYNVYKGVVHPQVGFEDANETLDTLVRSYNKTFPMDPAHIESALWSCNLLNEQGEFWHPKGMEFEVWVKKMLKKDRFNPTDNTLTRMTKEEIEQEKKEAEKNGTP